MTANKYGNFLTIILVILIIGILVGLTFLGYNMIKDKGSEERKKEAMQEFDKNAGTVEDKPSDENLNENIEDEGITIVGPNQSQGSSNGGNGKKKTYHEGFVMIGRITIPKTNVKEPILDTVSPASLDVAVAALYPSNPQLNEPGNVVIIGHNYRNGKFFSDNDKLSVGDKISIKDESGRELTYKIYKKFQTTEQDTSFYTRDTKGAVEITLSTCTDDSKARIIILARAE